MNVSGLWEETGVPGGNPHKHRKTVQTPRRKAAASRWIQTRDFVEDSTTLPLTL
ncbi:hypothetical protein EXN66_Car003119 [Channa argus]|uniref:Uncharacterized protein n=1 Tax=Channa argus TaxID=215402 RepID=A0A6G1PB22_CHAAH|nr:hypothetical protein EXN66_Car003119 [Channa argus]